MTNAPVADEEEDALAYRSIHTGAVLGVVLGVLSSVVLFTAGASLESTLLLAPVPLLGLLVSLMAWRAVAAAPELYTGGALAMAGAALSASFLVGGVGYGGYVYATELPPGYTRTSFLAMKPDENDAVDRKPIPDDVLGLIERGEKVFLKGYIRPDSIRFNKNISDFLLVRDNQQCCFGDLSKVQFFDQVKVRLGAGLTTDYSSGLFRLGGVLRLAPGDPALGTPLTYVLDADYVR